MSGIAKSRPSVRAADGTLDRTTALRAVIVTLTLVGAGGHLAGCNIAAPVAYFVGGTGMIDAQHELADVPTVVFVDDRANVIGRNSRNLRMAIAEKLSEELMVRKILDPEHTIDPRDAAGIVSSRDRHHDLVPVDAIGRMVGADQVIYVEMLQFARSPDGVTPRPTATCRVRVVDAHSRKRLFPGSDTQQTSQQVWAHLDEVDPALFRSPAASHKLFESLAHETGKSMAKLFYRHEARDLGDRLTPR